MTYNINYQTVHFFPIIIIKYVYIAQNRVMQLMHRVDSHTANKMSSVYVWMFQLKCLELESQPEDCSMSEVPVRWNCGYIVLWPSMTIQIMSYLQRFTLQVIPLPSASSTSYKWSAPAWSSFSVAWLLCWSVQKIVHCLISVWIY